MNQARYFLAPVEVIDYSHRTRLLSRVMVSPNSIYRIFEESDAIRNAFLEGRIFTVKLDGSLLRGRLVREAGTDGVHYNLRLLDLAESSRERIMQMVQKRGFPSPWKREYPRIAIATLYEKNETPIRVVFPRVAGNVAADAVNFSFHGMLFEFLCSRLSMTEQVGQVIRFQILTSRGQTLNEIEARISRVYDETCGPGKLIRGLGVKFLSMPKDSRKRYDEMILDVCQTIRAGA